WMQGETDSRDSTKAHSYKENLTNFIKALRANIKGAENMRFVIGQISAKAKYLNVVQQAQYDVSQNKNNVSLVVTKDLPLKPDNTHYGPASQRELGKRFADIIEKGER
ncbi:MAG: hypothetical protein JXM70_23070, partial [Pirellulales bacterium]|nr:hypothetical protein [Pirellulales bacterium]